MFPGASRISPPSPPVQSTRPSTFLPSPSSEVGSAQSELKELQSRYKTQSQELSIAKATIKSLAVQVAAEITKDQELEQSRETNEPSSGSLFGSRVALQETSGSWLGEHVKNQEIGKLQREIEELKKDNSSLRGENSSLQGDNEELTRKFNEACRRLQEDKQLAVQQSLGPSDESPQQTTRGNAPHSLNPGAVNSPQPIVGRQTQVTGEPSMAVQASANHPTLGPKQTAAPAGFAPSNRQTQDRGNQHHNNQYQTGQQGGRGSGNQNRNTQYQSGPQGGRGNYGQQASRRDMRPAVPDMENPYARQVQQRDKDIRQGQLSEQATRAAEEERMGVTSQPQQPVHNVTFKEIIVDDETGERVLKAKHEPEVWAGGKGPTQRVASATETEIPRDSNTPSLLPGPVAKPQLEKETEKVKSYSAAFTGPAPPAPKPTAMVIRGHGFSEAQSAADAREEAAKPKQRIFSMEELAEIIERNKKRDEAAERQAAAVAGPKPAQSSENEKNKWSKGRQQDGKSKQSSSRFDNPVVLRPGQQASSSVASSTSTPPNPPGQSQAPSDASAPNRHLNPATNPLSRSEFEESFMRSRKRKR